MKKLIIVVIAIIILTLLGIYFFRINEGILQGAALIDSLRRTIFAECITSFSDESLESFMLTEADLNSDNHTDAFVQYKDEKFCGSTGCVYELCLSHSNGSYSHKPFGYAGKSIKVLETRTDGMQDIAINGNLELRMIWNGNSYVAD